jgi:hypothetical protein
VGAVLLDFHTSAAAIPLLPTPQFTIEECLLDGQTGWHSRQKSYKSLSVRFSGRVVTKHTLKDCSR